MATTKPHRSLTILVLTSTLFSALVTVAFAAHPGSQPAIALPASKIDAHYEGPWVTTNRKLDGTLKCDVAQVAPGSWRGRFWGTWQGVDFDYPVTFAAAESAKNPDAVQGSAMIDGASYQWTGKLTPEEFRIQFTGSRYEGHVELNRVSSSGATTAPYIDSLISTLPLGAIAVTSPRQSKQLP